MIGRRRHLRGGPGRLPGWAAVAGLALVVGLTLPARSSPLAEKAGQQGRTQPSLSLTCSAWIFPSRPLAVTLEQSGVLAGRALAVDLFVDDNQWQRVTTRGGPTSIRLDLPPLAPGNHVLVARSAREVARSDFRVVSWGWLAGVVSAILGVGGLLFAFRRRRLRAA